MTQKRITLRHDVDAPYAPLPHCKGDTVWEDAAIADRLIADGYAVDATPPAPSTAASPEEIARALKQAQPSSGAPDDQSPSPVDPGDEPSPSADANTEPTESGA